MKIGRMIVALAFVGLISAAPGEAMESMSLGPQLGINIANLTGSDVNSSGKGSRIGIVGGGAFGMHFTKLIGLQVELLYSQKGAEYSSVFGDVAYEFAYLDLPIMITFDIASDSKIHPRLFIGPSFGFLLSADGVDSSGSTDISDDYSGFDVGIAGGIAVLINTVEGQAVSLEVRHTQGLTTIIDASIFGTTPVVLNSVTSVRVGYEFSL